MYMCMYMRMYMLYNVEAERGCDHTTHILPFSRHILRLFDLGIV
jgi:hypothetical protein